MQRFYALLLLVAGATLSLSAQNGIIGQGFAPGFNNPNDIVSFDASAGASRILITQSNATGNQFFRMVRAWNFFNEEYGPALTCPDDDQFITANEGEVLNGVPNCGKAFAIDVANTTDNYVFKTPNPDVATEFIFFRIQGEVLAFDPANTAQAPANNADGEVPSDTPILVGNLLGPNPFPPGQAAYVRYTTDGFASSVVLPLTPSGTLYTAVIPAQEDGVTVTYYFFTTGDAVAPEADGSDADYRTINLENNNGANYTYVTNRVLPVTYAAWSGRRIKTDVVRLDWATATEDQASHFTLECSQDDGRSWMERALIPATNRPEGATYSFTDEGTPTSDLQYRLKQTDFDGAFEYSAVITVAGQEAGLEVWPQPAGETINLRTPAELVGTTATLTDLNGRTIRSTILAGGQQTVDISNVAPGIYLLRAGEREVRKVVIR